MCRYAQFTFSSRQLNYRGFLLNFLNSPDVLSLMSSFSNSFPQNSDFHPNAKETPLANPKILQQ